MVLQYWTSNCIIGLIFYSILSNIIGDDRLMINNFLRRNTDKNKSKENQIRRKPNIGKESFDHYFTEVMRRKDNQFCVLQTPQLIERMDDISATFNDRYKSAMSSPPVRVLKTLERNKYIEIKQRLKAAIEQLGKSQLTSVKDVFHYRQIVLSQFLNELAVQMQKECKEKGEILKYIWNSMLSMVEQISETVGRNLREGEKVEMQNSLKSHQIYQQMIESYHKKQLNLNEKINLERITINTLVYELRFKRKEINKLYRNQKMLVNKLNEFKNDNLHLQGSYIDLMSTVRDMPPETAGLLLKAREQINKSQHVRFNIKGNRKHNRADINKELKTETEEQLDDLYEELKEIATNELHSPHLVSTLIEAAIENYGIRNEQLKKQKGQQIVEVAHKRPVVDAETQISQVQFRDPGRSNEITQFGFAEKLCLQLINFKGTQTYCQYDKRKVMVDSWTAVDSLLNKNGVERDWRVVSVYGEAFLYRNHNEEPTLKLSINVGMHHNKQSSEAKLAKARRGSRAMLHQNSLKEPVLVAERLLADQCSEAVTESAKHEVKEMKFAKKVRRSTKLGMGNLFAKARQGLEQVDELNQQKDESLNHDYKKSNFVQGEPLSGSQQDNFAPIALLNHSVSAPNNQRNSQPKLRKNREESRGSNFLEKGNYFNIEINKQKQGYIQSRFVKKQCPQSYMDQDNSDYSSSSGSEDIQQQDEFKTTKNILAKGSDAGNRRGTAGSSTSKLTEKRGSTQIQYNDENDLLLNLCRSSYNRKAKKYKDRASVFKYRDQFASVKDDIELVAKDVSDLVLHKETLLKKTINSKNIKNTYKILMMTFSKAYDSYNKGVIITNLVYPLFESFAVVYGAINNTEIYKKMINFIAALSVNTENTILKFFLFFLGLDSKSPYSEKVTISQVYLCLKLLQKISSEGKVTLNIESIYTDTDKIKKQLINILKEEKIPDEFSINVEKRVVQELQNSCLYKNSSEEDSHLKINIYNIILLIIQEVIKCKHGLRQSFLPVLCHYEQYRQAKKMPIYILQIVLSLWKFSRFDYKKRQVLIRTCRRNSKTDTVTIEQFCSILFQCNLISLDQLYLKSRMANRKGWKMPADYILSIRRRAELNRYDYPLQKQEIDMLLRFDRGDYLKNVQYSMAMQKMSRLLFEKHFERQVQSVTECLLGSDFDSFKDID